MDGGGGVRYQRGTDATRGTTLGMDFEPPVTDNHVPWYNSVRNTSRPRKIKEKYTSVGFSIFPEHNAHFFSYKFITELIARDNWGRLIQ
jgi:hypothetical protein